MNTILIQPAAAPVMNSLRSIGYTAYTAIADLIDNSIDAKASIICVDFQYEVLGGCIRIIDNGIGMDEATLQDAMTIGSKDPRVNRGDKELGRFGMGLKTSSFSLGKRLSVLTKQNGVYVERCWDLDYVSKRNRWELFTKIPQEVKSVMGDIEEANGTIVCIDKLDRFMGAGSEKVIRESSFNNKIRRVKNHLEFIYHSIMMEQNLSLHVNGLLLKAWDPFLLSNPRVIEGEQQYFRVNKHTVKVTPYVMPHSSYFNTVEYKEAGGIKGWRDQQGFYVYRENRLLYYGDWLNLLPKETSTQLARIRIDIPNTADSDWQVDVKKSMIIVPDEIKETLKQIAKQYRRVSSEIYYFRSKSSLPGQKIKGSMNTWELSGLEEGCQYILNRTHPLLNELIKNLDDKNHKLLNLYLKFVELGSPANIMNTPKSEEEEIIHVEEGLKDLMVQFAKSLVELDLFNSLDEMANNLLMQPAFESLNRNTILTILKENDINI